MAVLLVSIAVMGVLMSMMLPAWKTAVQRDREDGSASAWWVQS